MRSKLALGLVAAAVIGVGAYAVLNRSSVPKNPYRIGIVSGVDAFASISDGFRAGMADLGYKDDRDVIYDYRRFNADSPGQEKAIKEFIAARYDLIFTFPTGPTTQAKTLTEGTGIPVVFGLATIEDTGLVASVREPGGNLTGVRYPGPELMTARFDFLRELKPGLKSLLIAYDVNYPANNVALKVIRPLAQSAGVTLVEMSVTSIAELKAALDTRAARAAVGVDAILIMPENLTQSPAGFALLVDFARKHKIPIGGSAAYQADVGAVFTYIGDNFNLGKLAAPSVDKILRGTPAGKIPIITPESYLRFNYRLAKELGLTVSESFLRRADEIIR